MARSHFSYYLLLRAHLGYFQVHSFMIHSYALISFKRSLRVLFGHWCLSSYTSTECRHWSMSEETRLFPILELSSLPHSSGTLTLTSFLVDRFSFYFRYLHIDYYFIMRIVLFLSFRRCYGATFCAFFHQCYDWVASVFSWGFSIPASAQALQPTSQLLSFWFWFDYFEITLLLTFPSLMDQGPIH